MERLRRSWRLFTASWAMLREDRSLLMYPIVSGIAMVILVLLIGAPLALTGMFDTDELTVGQVAGLFLIYFVAYATVIFGNAALVSVVMRRMEGKPTDDAGWAFARSQLGSILGYAAIAATVGVVLNLLSRRDDVGGQIAGAIGGAAWSIATFLVVPVLVVEQVGPIDALKRSASLLRRTWGEQLIGNAGLGIISMLLVLAVGGVGALLVWAAAAAGSAVLTGLAITLVVVALGLTFVVMGALDTIYRAAVYRYANNLPLADYRAADTIPAAFTQKR